MLARVPVTGTSATSLDLHRHYQSLVESTDRRLEYVRLVTDDQNSPAEVSDPSEYSVGTRNLLADWVAQKTR